MSDYHIRLYKDSDYGAARDLFARGIFEPYPSAFRHTLTLPWIWFVILVMFLLPFWITGSITVSILIVAISLAALWFCIRYMYISFINYCLADDMLDIQKYYMQRDGYCFWVAKSGGEVVGTVAAVPSSHPAGEKHIELKRMSIARNHRGRGIAKALCRTLIDFARQGGYSAVVLGTSMVQIDAQWLYEKMGFRQTHTLYPSYIMAVVDFMVLFYRYDIPANG
ncbi:N-acetyltransferase 8-like [Pelodytes ibericus]